MPDIGATSRGKPIAVWLISMLTLGVLGAVVATASHTEFLDCSVPETFESANTPLGWSMALLATVVPLIIGVILGVRHSRRLIGLAIAVAGVQSVIWIWVLTTPADCGSAFTL